jgi:hypothetical protein
VEQGSDAVELSSSTGITAAERSARRRCDEGGYAALGVLTFTGISAFAPRLERRHDLEHTEGD